MEFQEGSFQRVLKRISDTKDTLTFRNPSGIRILVRYNEPDEDARDIAFDVAIYATEKHAHVRRALENNVSPYTMLGDAQEDEDHVFVLDEFVLAHDFTPRDTFEDALHLLNSVWKWRVCQCGQYFIKDGGVPGNMDVTSCMFCDLRGPKIVSNTCCICYEPFDASAAAVLPCCGKTIDGLCYSRCKGSCPFCRETIPLHLPPYDHSTMDDEIVITEHVQDAISETA
jgi:hypothetical protein